MTIQKGELVILVLHSPREKIWGILHEIKSAGIILRGIDLNYFEDFVRAFQTQEPYYGFSNVFFPLWRVERMSLDEIDGDIPSLIEQFVSRTGVKRDFFVD